MKATKQRRRPWWASCRWQVETFSVVNDNKWVAIYQAATRDAAVKDAAAWAKDTGDRVRIVRGPGHRTIRNGATGGES